MGRASEKERSEVPIVAFALCLIREDLVRTIDSHK